MKYGKDDIYQIIDLYNCFLYTHFALEDSIQILQDEYRNDQIKSHTWMISPICVEGHTYHSIILSDNALGDILLALSTLPFKNALEVNEDIIKNSLK
jgi:hypothetical protein